MDLAEFYSFRWVLVALSLRDIKLRYKQTALGIIWVVLQPLLTAALFTILFGRVLHLESDGVPYSVFAFSGLVPWLFFSGSLQRGSGSLISDTRLITKVYFPRVFIPLSACLGVLIDYCISLALVFVLLFYYHIPITAQVLFLPICTLVLVALSAGANFFFSSISVYFRDFKHIIPFFLQFWMYASPLVYSASAIPQKYKPLFFCNPMVGIIEGFRYALLGIEPFPESFMSGAALSIIILIFGLFFFQKMEPNFADVI